jgi:hypothetical protein
MNQKIVKKKQKDSGISSGSVRICKLQQATKQNKTKKKNNITPPKHMTIDIRLP